MRRVRSSVLQSVSRLSSALQGRRIAGGAAGAHRLQGSGAPSVGRSGFATAANFSTDTTANHVLRPTAHAFGALLVGLCLSLALTSSAHGATKYVDRVVGTVASGTTGGLFNGINEVAVNTTGAGGVPAGTFYVLDSTNRRVQRFSSAGVFQRAWGANVLTAPATEVQRLTVAATGGTYTLSYKGATTPPLAVNASAVTVRDALRNLPTLGNHAATGSAPLNVAGGAGNATGSSPYTITFTGHYVATNVDQITVDTTLLTGTATVTTTTQGSGAFEICTVAASCRAGAATAGANGGNADKNGSLALFTSGGGIAVDGDTGHVFVGDYDANRINVYDADGAFLRAFGVNVVDSGPGDTADAGYEICVHVNGDICRPGSRGTSLGQNAGEFARNPDVAISPPDGNPSTGKVYVTDPSNTRINVFDVNGSNPSSIGSSAEFASGTPSELAVGGGTLYATSSATEVRRYDIGASTFVTSFDVNALNSTVSSTAPVVGLDIDAAGNLLLARRDLAYGVVTIATPAGTPTIVDRHLTGVSPQGAVSGPLAGEILHHTNSGNFSDSVPSGTRHQVLILNDGPTPANVAIRGATEVEATTATLNATIDSSGTLPTSYQFQYSSDGVVWTTAASGTAPAGTTTDVNASATRLRPGTTYRTRIVANRTFGNPDAQSTEVTFITDAAPTAAPAISDQLPAWVEETKATLQARINPRGLATHYFFEYGTSAANLATRIPAAHGLFLGAGTDPVVVEARPTSLAPDRRYYWRVTATNASGTTVGPVQEFETLNPDGLTQGRRFELVSPPDKGLVGEVAQPVQTGLFTYPPMFSADGDSMLFPIGYGMPDSGSAGEPVYRATRGSGGWRSFEFSPPTRDRVVVEQNEGFLFAAKDHSCAFVTTPQLLTDDPEAVAVADAQRWNTYLRGPDGDYTLVPKIAPQDPTAVGLGTAYASYRAVGASESCDRFFFTTQFTYDGVAAVSAGGAAGFIYEWDNGTLRSPGFVPGPSGPVEPFLGIRPGAMDVKTNPAALNIVSEDGSRFFFTALSRLGGDVNQFAVFVREDGATAVDVSQSKTATPNNGASYFQKATPDGRYVYFTARYGLAPNASSSGATACSNTTSVMGPGCDLYRYDVQTGQLLDVSASSNPDDTGGASVAGILDASDDGSTVYFAAQGQLVPGQGQTYAENTAASTAGYNIYGWRSGTTSYVTSVSARDVDESAILAAHPNASFGSLWTSRATPDGRHLVFQSAEGLDGFPAGTVQAYRYSAPSEDLECVSCPRDGTPSVAATKVVNTAMITPLRPRLGLWTATRFPSVMSDDGSQIAFSSPDQLAPGAVSGADNFYYWHEGQISLLASDVAFSKSGPWGVTGDGKSIFLTTDDQLVPWDTDGRKDLYVARIGGGLPAPASQPAGCDGLREGACDGPAKPAPASTRPATVTEQGDGNAAEPGRLPEALMRRVAKLSRAQLRALARGRRVRLGLRVNRPGRVVLTGRARIAGRNLRVARASSTVDRAGPVRLRFRLSARSRRELRRTGRLAVGLTLRFADAPTRRMRVVLKAPTVPSAERGAR